MPVITLEGPKVENIDRKRDFAAKLTQLVADFYNIRPEAIVILLKENSQENVASGGRLIIDLAKPADKE